MRVSVSACCHSLRIMRCAAVCLGILFVLVVAQPAYAGAIASVLCVVVNWFVGPLGRALATLAIIMVGVGATLGKVSWGLAITVAVGISVMLGAPSLILALTGATSGC